MRSVSRHLGKLAAVAAGVLLLCATAAPARAQTVTFPAWINDSFETQNKYLDIWEYFRNNDTTRFQLWTELGDPFNSGDDFFFVREAVATGLGIGAMPCFMATQELAAGRFVRVLPEYQYALGAMYVMYPGGKPIPAKISAFTEYLRKHAPRLL